ncbi:MAG: cell envelope integrity protein TolA [Pseudomonadota bacterium]|nr:cell envelope integrity protein TolA [Pseudomonadota bacterium]
MRETRADTRVAVVAAIVLHALLFALMFAGMWWTRTAAPVSAAGPAIEADLVDPNALAAPLRRALDAPAIPPEPEPEPVVEPEPVPPEPAPPEPAPEPEPPPPETQPQPQERIPVPDPREQERVEREAEAARQAAREQEEKRRQEQVDLTERKRQQEAEQKQREIARKLQAIRAEQAKAKRAAELAEQKLRQIEDAKRAAAATSAAPPPPGNQGVDTNLSARYAAALTEAILRNWTRPESVPLGQRCVIVIRQVPGGTVIEARVDPGCPYDELGQRSIEAAVLKAQPLPYAGFESVFSRTLRLNFEAADR